MLTPHERTGVDAAGEGCYTTLHRDIDRRSAAGPALLSRAGGARVGGALQRARGVESVARLVREFPARAGRGAALRQHARRGARGARPRATRRAVAGGCARPGGVAHAATALQRAARRQHRTTRRGTPRSRCSNRAPEDCRRFLDACFLSPARVGTVRQLARRLGVRASTLMSRFYRAQPAGAQALPRASPAWCAPRRCFENPGLSITQVANALEYSSPQSFGRHVHTMLGVTRRGLPPRTTTASRCSSDSSPSSSRRTWTCCVRSIRWWCCRRGRARWRSVT